MGDTEDKAWMASRLREQGCEILSLKAEIERLRALLMGAYDKGATDELDISGPGPRRSLLGS